MFTRVQFAFLAFAIAVPAVAQSGPGEVDATFTYPSPTVLERDSTNAVPLAGGFLVVRSRGFERGSAVTTLELTRIDEDGVVVTSFGTGGTVVHTVPAGTNLSGAATLLDDGSIMLGGYQRTDVALTGEIDLRRAALARVDAGGRFDPSFGNAGIATFELPGDMGRVAAIDVLPDGRLLAGAWSRMEYNPYDCDEDRVALVRLESDGSRPETLYAAVRNGFVSCRNTLTLQVVGGNPGGPTEIFFGSELGIVAIGGPGEPGGPITRTNWRYGTFLIGPSPPVLLVMDGGDSFGLSLFPNQAFGFPNLPSGMLPWGLLSGLGFADAAAKIVFDDAARAWYAAFSRPDGMVGLVKYRSDRTIDIGWGGGDGTVSIPGTGRSTSSEEEQESLATDARLVSVRPGGNVVVVTADGVILRLVGRSDPALEGALSLDGRLIFADEGAGYVQLTVDRVGGTRGPVSVEYRVYAPESCDTASGIECENEFTGLATPQLDFVPSSGRLDWSDADGTSRVIKVNLQDDAIPEGYEYFYVELRSPGGGAGMLLGLARVYINESDKPAPPPAAGGFQGGSSGGSGGGGAAGPALLALLLAVTTRRRPSTRGRRPLSLVPGPLCLTPPARLPSLRRSPPPPHHPPAPATRTRAPA